MHFISPSKRKGSWERIERFWCSHRSGIARAAEVFRKVEAAIVSGGGRIGQPDDVGPPVVFLASQDARWTTVIRGSGPP